MRNNPELEELEREFARPGSQMHVDVYRAKREAILARPPHEVRAQEEARKASEAAARDEKFVRYGQFKKTLLGVTKDVIFKHFVAPLRSRVAKLEAKMDAIPTAIAIPTTKHSQEI